MVTTKAGKPKRMKPLNKVLTDDNINHLQFYYGRAITRNVGGTTENMRKDIMAALWHLTSTDAYPRHDWCSESWCFWKKAVNEDMQKKAGKRNASPMRTPSHSVMKLRLSVNQEEYKKLESVYTRLSDDSLLNKCLKVKTQNPNESIHSRIWSLCPKVVSVSKGILDFAVAQSCLIYNKG